MTDIVERLLPIVVEEGQRGLSISARNIQRRHRVGFVTGGKLADLAAETISGEVIL